MAVFDGIHKLDSSAPTTGTVAAAASSAAIDLKGGLYLFHCTEKVHLRFGDATVAASSASYTPIPAGTLVKLWLSTRESNVRIFNAGGAVATYHFTKLEQ